MFWSTGNTLNFLGSYDNTSQDINTCLLLVSGASLGQFSQQGLASFELRQKKEWGAA